MSSSEIWAAERVQLQLTAGEILQVSPAFEHSRPRVSAHALLHIRLWVHARTSDAA